jgi:putative transposase
MRKSRFTESQIVSIPREADNGLPIKDVVRNHGISVPTYYKWKSRYGGMDVAELARVRELETENSKLKRMYAELALENAAIKDLIEKKAVEPLARREVASSLVADYGLSIRRACRVARLPQRTWYRACEAGVARDAPDHNACKDKF